MPAGTLAVPFGVVEVCQAATSRTQTSSNSTVPPRFGSETFSTPASPSSPAISAIATTCAPLRLAISSMSPKWSGWPCVRKMCVGSSSSGCTAALGLPLRNGSTSTRVSPSDSSKHEWPRKRMSIQSPPGSFGFPSSAASCQPTATPISMPIRVSSASSVSTRAARSASSGAATADRTSLTWAVPNQPPSSSACASTRWSCGAASAIRRSAPANRSGSDSARTAASTCSSVNTAEMLRTGRARKAREQQADQRAGERSADRRADVGHLGGQREQHQHRGDDVDAEHVVLPVVAAPGREAILDEPRAQQAERGAVRPEDAPHGRVRKQRRGLERPGDGRARGTGEHERQHDEHGAEAALEERAEDADRDQRDKGVPELVAVQERRREPAPH